LRCDADEHKRNGVNTMLSQAERDEVLAHSLARHAAGSWEREFVEAGPEGNGEPLESRYSQSTTRPFGRLTVLVHLRGDGDIDVCFEVPAHEPERLELHFPLPSGDEREAILEVAELVGGFFAERLVLSYDKSIRGGPALISVHEFTPAGARAWCVSWRGTFDG
jgi:hypothetical protein